MTVRWGFVGAGWIAGRAMAPAVHASDVSLLQAVASRDVRRSAGLEPVTVHASYAALVEDPDVDVVYVCLANHLHEEWTTRALAAGKHVLCEKPLATDLAAARRMARAARAADRLLVEAVWCRWHPRMRRLETLVGSGGLGPVRSVETAFTFPADLAGNYRQRPEMGGGALLDVGGYQVHTWLAVAQPDDRVGAAETSSSGVDGVHIESVERVVGESGIDLTTRVAARLGSDVRATALASFAMPERQAIVVEGAQASARTGTGAAFTTWREPSSLLVGGHQETFPPVDAYRLMVDSVSARSRGEDAWCVPLADTLAVTGVLEAVAAHPA